MDPHAFYRILAIADVEIGYRHECAGDLVGALKSYAMAMCEAGVAEDCQLKEGVREHFRNLLSLYPPPRIREIASEIVDHIDRLA